MYGANGKIYKLVGAAAIGSIYAALTMVLAPISYGALQLRISEALCIIPFFFPASAAGLFVGCIIANIMSAAGILDIIFGSLATLLAGICTAAIGSSARKKETMGEKAVSGWGLQIIACAMPVLFNAPIVGIVLAYSLAPGAFWEGVVLFGAQVGLGEAAVMFAIGLPLIRLASKNDRFMGLMERFK